MLTSACFSYPEVLCESLPYFFYLPPASSIPEPHRWRHFSTPHSLKRWVWEHSHTPQARVGSFNHAFKFCLMIFDWSCYSWYKKSQCALGALWILTNFSEWSQTFVSPSIALIGKCPVSSTFLALLRQYPSETKPIISILLKVPDQEWTINTINTYNVYCPFIYSVI